MNSMRLGSFDLAIVSDGTYFLDGGNFFGIVPKVLWQKRAEPDELNRLSVGLNSVLLRGGGKTVLIETGIGNKLSEKMARNFAPQAKLLENLRAAECAPEQVDIVINSHLHFDHCGWNTVRPHISECDLLRSARRMGSWQAATRARLGELHQR
jgi:glyoxylase-like metal-dependent hydrolase (beta-lactamase superfamily II)